MIPRTVKVAKAVADTLTEEQLATYGNVIGPFYRGWTTNYKEYYTKLPPNDYGVNPGDPTMFSYWVPNFSASNEPQWAQPPALLRNYTGIAPVNAIYPRANNPLPPPIDTL
jgi:hypothetical protein